MGVFLYLLALSLLHLFTKSSVAAVQSVLHVLFLPTPFKFLSQTIRNQPKAKNNSLIDHRVIRSTQTWCVRRVCCGEVEGTLSHL
ncbi:hypothetical protein C8J55DRAFT_529482 [Lentinula edodes]|uniref:Secreted protein n=1 Tax=Lentinula lateritia TaxID=40482 RepID=A0A9W8ZSV3_9AGAR|nr:hypothetical protein C8J55DRAFT_529482 [Lentinula edodes]